MTTREAVETLSEQARRLASRLHVVLALALVGASAPLVGIAILLQWALFDVASVKVAAIVGLAVPIFIGVPIGRLLVRRTIALRRASWIQQLAREQGLNAAELEQYFTLDSW